MTRNDLIASVAVDHIKDLLNKEEQGTLRICMLGLKPEIVRRIALAASYDGEVRESLLIKVNTIFDQEGELPRDLRSDESITHWRHCPLTNPKRAVLFAATQEEIQRNNKSVEKVTKIEPDTLRTLNNFWINQAGLTQLHLQETQQKHLQTALDAANRTDAARTIEHFADFVRGISEAILIKSLPPQKAVDDALPALNLPRNSGDFDDIAENKRDSPSAWAKIFRRLLTKTRDLLFRENSRGEPIDGLLAENFEAVKDKLTDSEKEVILAFLDAEDISRDGWADCQIALVNLDWHAIRLVFEGIETPKRKTLGERTIKFLDEEDDELLDEDLKNLLASVPPDPTEELKSFFNNNRELLAFDKRLYSSWEKYIYRNPVQSEDFFEGFIATLHRLFEGIGDKELSQKRVVVRIHNSRRKSFWRDKNSKVVRYFATRYRGIQDLFGLDVTFDFGKLYDYYLPRIDDDFKNSNSRSRDARSLKFEVELDPEGVKAKSMFIWHMPVDAIATNMADDLLRIANEQGDNGVLLSKTNITKQPISAKGQIQRVNLNDVNTIRDVNGLNNGTMVDPNSPTGDYTQIILQALDDLSKLLSEDKIVKIRIAFSKFRQSYESAIRDWISVSGKGIGSETLLTQAEDFGELLNTLHIFANNGRARKILWKECMFIGTADLDGTRAAVILPWHPFRMAELHIKSKQAAKTVNTILRADKQAISRADIFFQQKQEELLSDYYPEVCIGVDGDRYILLSLTESKFGYSIAEPPQPKMRGQEDDSPDTLSRIAAKAFSNIAQQFLTLLPHEQNNFSVVLYDAESNAVPSALVEELSKKVQQETELQCDLLLTHSDPTRMRKIYEQQNVAVGDDSGSIIASEAAKNFLSRLRVAFFNRDDLSKSGDIRTSDLVALYDVVTTSANLVWKKSPTRAEADFQEHVPRRWSRRKPISKVDTSSTVYLVAPKQPRAGQIYLNTIQTFLEGENARGGDVLPALEVDFSNGRIRNVFDEAHEIGEWVVNYDELVNRRLFDSNRIQVIRHIHDRSVNRNITVSTTSGIHMLRTLIIKRLNLIDRGIIKTHGDAPVDQLIKDASKLSGQVVMRAARYGRFANELIGIVLSMEMIKSRIGNASLPIGWYFLDDYASWFGQREEQIADIMAIAPRIEEGKHILRIVISEAKFVSSNGYKGHAKKSERQLEETISRLSRALYPSQHRIDRNIWLHRIGDFIINGIDEFGSSRIGGWSLHKWSDEVRKDHVSIYLEGFSHVFVHDNEENVSAIEPEPLRRFSYCYRQIFDKPQVIDALREYANGKAATDYMANRTRRVWKEIFISKAGQIGLDEATEDIPTSENGAKEENIIETPVADRESQNDPVPKPEQSPPIPRLPIEISKWLGQRIDQRDEEVEKWQADTVRTLQRGLRAYDLSAELIDSRLTPNAVRVRFRGSNDMTVTKVERRRQELLTSHAIRVIDVIPAPMEVIIMVARPKRDILHLKDVWRHRELPEGAPQTNSSLLLGAREEDGKLLHLNVEEAFAGLSQHGPHTLIAGQTGSGKGVLVQCLLLDICATNSPDSAKIRMIDPKFGIDFGWLRGMPHLDGELITTQDRAVEELEKLVEEMERRNRLLADASVSKLSKYNQNAPPSERLPRIWLFHDELADWMLIPKYRDAVGLNVSRLGVKARAAGIHLVLITQRPDKDAMPMQLRANLPNRLVLKVADKANSVLVLGEPGAERLLGRGHLAAKLSGEPKIMFAQVPFADEDEINELAAVIVDAWSDKIPS